MDKKENKYMIPIFSTMGIAVLIVTSQVLWKLTVNGKVHNFSSFLAALTSPLVIMGAIIYALVTVIWIFMLSKYQYHLIYPTMSLTYVLALLASRFIFHEQVFWTSWLGVGIICLGIIIISLGFKG
jgi:drug/metabolite transporter (DMT)-like permease